MRIAICYSQLDYMNELKRIIYRYAVKMKLELVVECYLSGEDMLRAERKYNIVFLEYGFTDRARLKTAQKIKALNPFCSMVLIGSEGVFAGDVFMITPAGYLTRSVSEEQVYRILSEYFYKIGSKYPLLIKSRGDTFCLNTSEIVYLEANNKRCIVHLEEDEIDCNKTMAKVYEDLPKRLFLKINRAFVINFRYIDKFNRDSVILKNGERLYISRNYHKSFKEDYISLINDLSFR